MLTLSIRQPYAWLIANGFKTVENRTWRTQYRGKILIHAGSNLAMRPADITDFRKFLFAESGGKIKLPSLSDMRTGGIVGIAEIVDCLDEPIEQIDRDWYEDGSVAFIIRNARPLPFTPIKGKLRLFEVNLPGLP